MSWSDKRMQDTSSPVRIPTVKEEHIQNDGYGWEIDFTAGKRSGTADAYASVFLNF